MELRNEYRSSGTDVLKLFGGVDPLAPSLKRAPDDEYGDEEEEELDDADEDEDELDDADFDEEDDDEFLEEDEEED